MWDLPGPGIKPVPSALAGSFFTTESRGKSQHFASWVMHKPHALASPFLGTPLCLRGWGPGQLFKVTGVLSLALAGWLRKSTCLISRSGINTHTNENVDSYSTEEEIWVSSQAIPPDPDPPPPPQPAEERKLFCVPDLPWSVLCSPAGRPQLEAAPGIWL